MGLADRCLHLGGDPSWSGDKPATLQRLQTCGSETPYTGGSGEKCLHTNMGTSHVCDDEYESWVVESTFSARGGENYKVMPAH